MCHLKNSFKLESGEKHLKARTTEEAVSRLKELGLTCSPRELAQILGGNPYYYNMAARSGTLAYDFEWHGRNLRIFTESVIRKIGG